MRHFPIFLDLRGRKVVVSGAGATAIAKLRLILKSEAEIVVFGSAARAEIKDWAAEGRIQWHERPLALTDLRGATLLYGADGDPALDANVLRLGNEAGVLTNIVDNLEASAFITPAIVDRDPVTVAIGTEGTAPVLARGIKADLEARLSKDLGALARLARAFRSQVEVLAEGRTRRSFWSRFFFESGPEAYARGGEEAAQDALDRLLSQAKASGIPAGRVAFVGVGQGDPDLLTRRAARLIDQADVVLHGPGVSGSVLELARREAEVLPAGSAFERLDDIGRWADEGLAVVWLAHGDLKARPDLDALAAELRASAVSVEIARGLGGRMAQSAEIIPIAELSFQNQQAVVGR